jgi:hypothetical protein
MMLRYSWDEFWKWASNRGLTMNEVARRVGSDRRELYRWREAGGVPKAAADRVAVKLGALPGEIWSAWNVDSAEMVEAHRARRRAVHAAAKRRYRQRHPEVRERERAYRRAYYADSADYEKAARRRYYNANIEKERARKRAS